MGKVHEKIDGRLRAFVEAQPMFFVATAPSGPDGHVNVSPKGIAGSFVVLDEHTVAYLDLTASGSETIAHLRENGRITLMFCAFQGPPNIVRLHGRGRFVTLYDEGFDELAALFPETRGARAVIVVDVRAGLRLVRLRRPAHDARGGAGPAAAVHGAQGCRGSGRLPPAQEPDEHRRAAGVRHGPGALPAVHRLIP